MIIVAVIIIKSRILWEYLQNSYSLGNVQNLGRPELPPEKI